MSELSVLQQRDETNSAYGTLSPERAHAQELFKGAKPGYSWRSKVVHGMRLRRLSPEKSRELMYEAEGFARQSLKKILTDPEHVKNFSGTQREEFLDSLIYSV